MVKKTCNTCRDEGVCWKLVPCPDCKKGENVEEIGRRVTKNLITEKIKSKKL